MPVRSKGRPVAPGERCQEMSEGLCSLSSRSRVPAPPAEHLSQSWGTTPLPENELQARRNILCRRLGRARQSSGGQGEVRTPQGSPDLRFLRAAFRKERTRSLTHAEGVTGNAGSPPETSSG